jgi:hypothetical protein
MCYVFMMPGNLTWLSSLADNRPKALSSLIPCTSLGFLSIFFECFERSSTILFVMWDCFLLLLRDLLREGESPDLLSVDDPK